MIPIEQRRANLIKRLKEEKQDEYVLIGEYKGAREQTTFKHTICGNVWATKPCTLLRTKGTLGCPRCQYKAKSVTTEEFKETLRRVRGGEFGLVDGQEYVNNRVKIEVIHNKCGTKFLTSPTNITREGACPSCRTFGGATKRKRHEEFEKELSDKHRGEYILTGRLRYSTANEKVEVQHVSCGYIWEVRAAHILRYSGCPMCYESKGEEVIKRFLVDTGVPFDREYKFPDCKNAKELPFDFAIFAKDGVLKGLIEYDGIQHFKPFKHFGGTKKFIRQQENDRIKTNYCAEKGIPLLRIPYKDSKNIVIHKVKNFVVGK